MEGALGAPVSALGAEAAEPVMGPAPSCSLREEEGGGEASASPTAAGLVKKRRMFMAGTVGCRGAEKAGHQCARWLRQRRQRGFGCFDSKSWIRGVNRRHFF